jgi:serine/threonine-protein kinase
VAIKILPEVFAQDADRMPRFKREAQVLASLNHPNIAAIYGAEERALVMELAEGSTLAERIAQGAIRLGEALPIARQIAEALEYAHERGVIHRDLKPGNIKITPEGRVKVLDFGLAKAMTDAPVAGDPASSPTVTIGATARGVIMGTPAYMSPEQASGKPVDKRTDIWSFGVVFWEMLTGKRLFQGKTVSHTLAAVLTQKPDLTRVPPNLRRLLQACFDENPQQRLRDIRDWAKLLDEAAPRPRGPRAFRISLAVVGAALLGAAAIAVVHFSAPTRGGSAMFMSIALPPGVQPNNIALSPDGTQLVISDWNQLWVRAVDSPRPASPPAGDRGSAPECLGSRRQRHRVHRRREVEDRGGLGRALANHMRSHRLQRSHLERRGRNSLRRRLRRFHRTGKSVRRTVHGLAAAGRGNAL